MHRLYIGTYTVGGSSSEGIYTCSFDDETGAISTPVLAAEAINPSFLAIHASGKFLYAVNEVSEGEGRANGGVSAYRIQEDGMLTLINQQPSLGGAPCHCNIDGTGKFLLIANYVGGNIVVYPIGDDGALGPASCNVQHEGSSVDKSRQEAAHAHSINLSADNRFAYAADLGTDRIQIYRFDESSGILEAASPSSVSVEPGGGPRHFSIHPNGKFAYSNNELTCMVSVFHRDREHGGLTRIQDLSTLPKDTEASVRRSTAECLVHPTGKFAYVSNRGHDSIAVYTVNSDDGTLTLVDVVSTGGQEPRNFVIAPNGLFLLAENQNSDTVITFEINQTTGNLKSTDHMVEVGRPVCIRFLP
ncbi:MAG: lactonase family protein [Planctomycetaceae bacterium]